jgi:uncharacterized membrane protein YfcA
MSAIPYLYAISGFAVGLLVGMTGVGGGALMTPMLILLFGIHPAAAVGTDLLHAAATKTAGSIVHGLKGTIDWTVVRRLAMGSVPMTVVTIAAMSLLDINGNAGRNLVNAVLTLALIVTAVVLVFRGRIVARYADRLGGLAPKQVAALTIFVGGVLGTIVSLSSVGAGAIGVTCLLLLYPRLPAVKIVGSDIAHAVPLTLVAGIGHWLLGSVDFQVFGLLILGSVPGILIGSYAAVRLPEPARCAGGDALGCRGQAVGRFHYAVGQRRGGGNARPALASEARWPVTPDCHFAAARSDADRCRARRAKL